MLAVMWAKSRPGTPVVNLDGHGRLYFSQYAGISEDDARRRVSEAEQRVKASLGALAGPLSPDIVDRLIAQQRALASQLHAPEEMFVQSIERTLDRRYGAAFLRPSPVGLGAEILTAAASFDMFSLYNEVPGPVLLVAGTAPDPGADRALMAAYRQGLRRDLEQVASTLPNVIVEFVPGGHGLLLEHPEDLANWIVSFLAEN